MGLLRSIFWLAVAFIAIGPRVDVGQSLSLPDSGAIRTAGMVALGQGAVRAACASETCLDAGVLLLDGVTASLRAPMVSAGTPDTTHATGAFPFPRPRLARKG